eukprot:sb/3474249/
MGEFEDSVSKKSQISINCQLPQVYNPLCQFLIISGCIPITMVVNHHESFIFDKIYHKVTTISPSQVLVYLKSCLTLTVHRADCTSRNLATRGRYDRAEGPVRRGGSYMRQLKSYNIIAISTIISHDQVLVYLKSYNDYFP